MAPASPSASAIPRAAPRLPPPTMAILPLSDCMAAVCRPIADIRCHVSRIICSYASGPAALDRAAVAGKPPDDRSRAGGAAGGFREDDPAGHGRAEHRGHPGSGGARRRRRLAADRRLPDQADGADAGGDPLAVLRAAAAVDV